MVLMYESSFFRCLDCSQKPKALINLLLAESNQKIILELLQHLKLYFLRKWYETETHIYFEKIHLFDFIVLEIHRNIYQG